MPIPDLFNVPVCSISDDYRPSENEKFMNQNQLEYFRRKLISWRNELLQESNNAIQDLQKSNDPNHVELLDRASKESELAFELRTENRARKLIFKIDAALIRIKNGTYGYCEITGDPISIKRLEARPIATLSVEAQEYHERQERTQRDAVPYVERANDS